MHVILGGSSQQTVRPLKESDPLVDRNKRVMYNIFELILATAQSNVLATAVVHYLTERKISI